MTEFHGNPESGIDQLLNRTDSNTTEPAKRTYEELEKQLIFAEKDRDNWIKWCANAEATINQARDSIETVLAGDIEATETFEAFQEAFELLGVSLNRQVEIEVTITWRGTIELPHGTDPEDLDIDDFASCDPDHNYYQTYFNQGIHDHSIREL